MTQTNPVSFTLTRRSAVAALGTALLLPLAACAGTGDSKSSGGPTPAPSAAEPVEGAQNPLGSLTGTPSLSAEQYETMVEGVASWVKAVWPLMGPVWPGVDYTRHRIVALQVDEQFQATRAWAISTEGHRELKADEFADIEPPSSYGKVTFEGQPSITLNLGQAASASNGPGHGEEAASMNSTPAITATGSSAPTADLTDPATFAFALMTHELVHFYYQGEINVTASSSRDTPYPYEARPRTLRRMLLDRLRLAATEADKRAEHLGHARYWLDTWKAEYAQEAQDIHHYDIAEGVARYVEYMALSIQADQSAEQLQARQAPLLGSESLDVSVDVESYAFGFVTGVLLDATKPDWKNGFYAGDKTLTELLLEDVTAVPEEVDPAVSGKVDELIKESDEYTAPDIKKIDDAEADTSVAYLRVDKYGEIGYGGSFAYKDKVVLTTTILVLSGEGQNLQILGVPTFTGTDRQTLTVPLIDAPHSYADGTLKVDGNEITGTIKAEKTTENGREVFVAK